MSFRKFGAGDEMERWTQKIQNIMDEMQNRMFVEWRASATWQPRVNAYAARDVYYLCVELAGLERDLVCVECLDERRVRISGQRPQPRTDELQASFSVELMEIDEGAFAREIDFHEPIDGQKIEMLYDRGYLWIILPKTNPP